MLPSPVRWICSVESTDTTCVAVRSEAPRRPMTTTSETPGMETSGGSWASAAVAVAATVAEGAAVSNDGAASWACAKANDGAQRAVDSRRSVVSRGVIIVDPQNEMCR